MPSKKVFCTWLLAQRKDLPFARWVFADLLDWEGSKVKLRYLSNEHGKLDEYYNTCKLYDIYLRDLEITKEKQKITIKSKKLN
jgi:hypothetical protein